MRYDREVSHHFRQDRLAAEAMDDLRHLDAHRTAAEDDQPPRDISCTSRIRRTAGRSGIRRREPRRV